MKTLTWFWDFLKKKVFRFKMKSAKNLIVLVVPCTLGEDYRFLIDDFIKEFVERSLKEDLELFIPDPIFDDDAELVLEKIVKAKEIHFLAPPSIDREAGRFSLLLGAAWMPRRLKKDVLVKYDRIVELKPQTPDWIKGISDFLR